MTDTLEIYVDHDGETHRVGTCRYVAKRSGQSSVFEYSGEWLANPLAFALDPINLPLDNHPVYTSSATSALPGALRDTAPDRWGQQLIKRAFRKANDQRTLSEIDYLLALNDHTRIGALRYKREGETSFDHDVGHYRVPPLIRLPELLNAADAVQTHSETAEDLKLLLNEGSPLGGARPKSAVADDDGSLVIAKFPKADDDRSIPHGEVLALTSAKAAGIDAASARLVDAAGRPVALINRFDRDGSRRIPFLSAMSMLGLNDGDEATYIDIAECIRMHSSAPSKDLHELWRRMVFNVLIGNLDDHLRNHGFLYDGNNQWRLAPAYDLNPVPLEEKTRELTTWISDEGPAADIDQAKRAIAYFGLSAEEAEVILAELSNAIEDWQNTARQIGMSNADIGVYGTAIGVSAQ